MKVKWNSYELMSALLLVIAAGSLFYFTATFVAEKRIRGVYLCAFFTFGSVIYLKMFLNWHRRGQLSNARSQRKIKWCLVSILLFVIALLSPTHGLIFSETDANEYCGGTPLIGEEVPMDARDQAGTEFYVKNSKALAGVEEDSETLKFSISDVCVGKVAHRIERDGPVNPKKADIVDKELLTAHIKEQAHAYGSLLVGIAPLQQEYIFTHNHVGSRITLNHTTAIVLGQDVPYAMTGPTTPLPWEDLYSVVPEEFAAALSGIEIQSTRVVDPAEVEEVRQAFKFFSEGGQTAVELAKYIRALGYQARVHYTRWSDVQIIPLAIRAGLGELSRNGMLVNDVVGPRGSFTVVTTNLPLLTDSPNSFGVKEFCKVCKKCAERCPAKAISFGDPQPVRGALKWAVDGEKCGEYLLDNPKCMACIGSCPYNKPPSYMHQISTFLSSKKSLLANYLLVLLDDLVGYGTPKPIALSQTEKDA